MKRSVVIMLALASSIAALAALATDSSHFYGAGWPAVLSLTASAYADPAEPNPAVAPEPRPFPPSQAVPLSGSARGPEYSNPYRAPGPAASITVRPAQGTTSVGLTAQPSATRPSATQSSRRGYAEVSETPAPIQAPSTPSAPTAPDPVPQLLMAPPAVAEPFTDRTSPEPETKARYQIHKTGLDQRLPPAAERSPNDVPSPSLQLSEPRPLLIAAQGNMGLSVRWAAPQRVNLDQEAACQLIVQNTGPDAASDVMVKLHVPKEAQSGHCQPEPEYEGRLLTWRLGQLSPGTQTTLNVGLTPITAGNLQPQAVVTCSHTSVTDIEVLEPQLELTIDGPREATLGETTNYHFVVTNRGKASATQVFVEAQLPINLEHPQGQHLRYVVGTLSPGESRQVAVPISSRMPGSYNISATAGLGTSSLAQAEFATRWQRATLALQMEGPKMRFVDRKASYTIKVENPSPTPLNNVQVFETVPTGFRFVEATSGGSFDPMTRQVAWFVGHLEPQQSASVSVLLLASDVGDHRLDSSATADGGITGKAESMTRVEGISSLVLDVADSDDPIEVAGETVYILRITNQGSQPSRGVQVAATVPAEMQVLDVHGPTQGTVDGQSVVFHPLDTLAAGKVESYQVRVRCKAAGQARFRAFFRSDDTPTPVVEEESTRVYAD